MSVDFDLKGQHPVGNDSLKDRLVQRMNRSDDLSSSDEFRLEHHPLLKGVFSIEEGRKCGSNFLGGALSDKSKSAKVNAKDRSSDFGAHMSGANNSSVAAKSNDEIGLCELNLRNRLNLKHAGGLIFGNNLHMAMLK